MSNGNLKKKGREARQIRALARRQADITHWNTVTKLPAPEDFSGTQEEWSKECRRKQALAEQEVEVLQEKLGKIIHES